MTFAAGWIQGSSAFLVGDSAVTREGEYERLDQAVSTTSFGETELVSHTRRIDEGAAKIIQISPGAVATFSGVAESGLATLRALRTRLRANPDIGVACEAEQHRAVDFDLLIAGCESGAPRLWRMFQQRSAIIYLPNTGMILGSSSLEHKQWFNSVLNMSPEGLDEDVVLARAIVGLQTRGQARSEFVRGVGGAYFGARADANGVRLNEDLYYTIHEFPFLKSMQSMTARSVMTGWGDGFCYSVAMLPVHGGQPREHSKLWHLFWPHVPEMNRAEILERMNQIETLARPSCTYVVFIDRESGSHVFVPRVLRPDLVHAKPEERGFDFGFGVPIERLVDYVARESRTRGLPGFAFCTNEFPPNTLSFQVAVRDLDRCFLVLPP